MRFFAATTGHDDEVCFPEDIPEDCFPAGSALSRRDALAAADAALFLAERDTGLAALADAMACGVPIAASNTPDVAERAAHDIAAQLSPAGAPRAAAANVLKLIEDRALRERLTAAGQRHAAECFGPHTCRARLLEIYAAAGMA